MSDMAAAEIIAEKSSVELPASGAQSHPSKYRQRGGDRLRRNAVWAEFAGTAETGLLMLAVCR
jgi:hypothetical protein